jgi:NADH-quinone oxidoreductase subunit G
VRFKPRFNAHVNKWWMCDEGRYSYKSIDDHRLTHPARRDGENLKEASWSDVLPEISSKLKTILEKNGPQSIAVLGSAQMPTEDLYLARKFFAETLGVGRLAFAATTDKPGYSDNFLITADKNPNRRGALATGWPEHLPAGQGISASGAGTALKALIVFRQGIAGLVHAEELSELARKLELMVFIGTNECPASHYAHYVLPAAAPGERDGTFANVDGLVQRFFRVLDPIAEALPEWKIITQWASACGYDYSYERCESVFSEMAESLPAFRGLSYAAMGKSGQRLAE